MFVYFSFQWVEEIRKHLRNVNPDDIFVITNGKESLEEYSKVVITSYDLMSTFKDKLLAKKFGIVIMVCIPTSLIFFSYN